MKPIILIISLSLILISCGKKSEENRIDKNSLEGKISKNADSTKKVKKQTKSFSDQIVKKETQADVISNALNFSKKINPKTSVEDGNVDGMTIADAKRILENSKELDFGFVEKIFGRCKNFDVVNYFMTNLAEKILNGKIHFKIITPDCKDLPPKYIEIVKKQYHYLNNNKKEAAAYILNELSIRSQSEKKYKYAIEISERLLKLSELPSLRISYYDNLSIAYNCLHDFDKEAETQKKAFNYFYENRKSLTKAALKAPLDSYISSLCNAGEYDTAIKLVKKLHSEKRVDNYNKLMEKLQNRDSQKSYRSF